MKLDLNLLSHQIDFVQDTTSSELALVGGFGCGKTDAMAAKLLTLACYNAGYDGLALSPTNTLAVEVLVPAIKKLLDHNKIKYRYLASGKPKFVMQIAGRQSILHILHADNNDNIIGYNAAYAGFDELDRMEPRKARKAWFDVSARLRRGLVNQICASTTPEGYGFVYEYFMQEVAEAKLRLESGDVTDPDEIDDLKRTAFSRRIIKARTIDNPFLPADYVPKLRAKYPSNLIEAYLNGDFVNMVGSPVYSSYDKDLNDTQLTISELHKDIPLHCGIDFNNNAMSCTVAYVAANKAFVLDELMGHKNTMALIAAIKAKYGTTRDIYVYPDASGAANKTSASTSDIEQLTAAGFRVFAPKGNPRVKNRINAVNARFANGQQPPVRALLVNQRTCKTLVKCLMQQTYKLDGTPVKDGVVDGPLDALGYFVHYIWPIDTKQGFTQSSIAA